MNSVPYSSFSVRIATAFVALGLWCQGAFAASPSGPAVLPSGQSAMTPAAKAEDIYDIRPPIHIPAPFPWLTWSLVALAAAGAGYGIWKLLRRQQVRQPYEIALEKLEKARALMRPETVQLFSQAVSEVVRRFIEECLPVRAAHRTTSEFLHDMVNLPDSPLAVHREALADFLQHCDLAKFARWSLSKPQMEAMLQSARAFVISIGTQAVSPKNAAVPSPGSTAELTPSHC